jgi:hypothetical protein
MRTDSNLTNTARINTVNTTLLTWILSILSVVCLTTGPQPLPKRILYRVRPSAAPSFPSILSLSLKVIQ